MDRRTFVVGAACLAIGTTPWAMARAQASAVRLLLVRERGYANKCLPCVAGRLYGVPSGIDLTRAEQTLSLLTTIADTVELSYEPNSRRPSSIPEATYRARVRADATKKWMWTGGEIGSGSVRPDRAWRLELQSVPHRSAIQFHFGRDAAWSRGCVILGRQMTACSARSSCSFPDSHESAVRALRDFVEVNAVVSNTPIFVRFVAAQ